MDSNSRFALVTGAGSGIGRAVALALQEAGYSVALAGRRAEALEETAALASASGGRMLTAPTDVSKPESVMALFVRIREVFSRLDVLFNNAGVNMPSLPIEDVTFEQWSTVLSVNLTGVFLCAQEAYKLMKEQTPQGGRIINNGSLSAYVPRTNSTAYTTAKHGVTGLTKCLSLDGRKYGIACGQIDIGNADTEMLDRFRNAGDPVVAPPEPRIKVKQVAEAVLYMASLPLSANVQFMTVMATKMPFIGRG